MNATLLQALSAFGAGLATSLSPCVYPMIPITVGFLGSGSEGLSGRKSKVLGFFLGQIIAFTLLGVIAVSLGEILGFSSEVPAVQIFTGSLLLVFGVLALIERLPEFLYRLNKYQSQNEARTWASAFIIGMSSAAMASPCTSPVVGGILAAVSQVEERLWGITLMFLFSVGLSSLFLVVGLGLAKASSLPKAGRWMRGVHKISSVLLILGGGYFVLSGFELL